MAAISSTLCRFASQRQPTDLSIITIAQAITASRRRGAARRAPSFDPLVLKEVVEQNADIDVLDAARFARNITRVGCINLA
jgi:hypothetical protein